MKQFTLLFCIFALIVSSVNAQDNSESLTTKVDTEYSNSFINKFNKVFNSIPDPDNPRGNDGTSIIMEAQANWDKLTPAAKKEFNKLQEIIDELPYTIDSQHGYFRYHFTDSGDDSIDIETDENNNGFPDFIEFYDSCFTFAKNNYVAAGYTLPSVSGFYDIYISNAACSKGVYGYTFPKSFVGDNLDSPEIETNSYSSYIVIRGDFSGFTTGQDKSVKVTSSHEFFHAIQMAVNYVLSGSGTLDRMFIMEGCAVWSEEWNYKGSFDAYQYLGDYFNKCDMQLNFAPINKDDDNYVRPYGTWVFYRYLTDLYGDNFIKKLYYNCIGRSQEAAFEKTFKDYGTDFRTVLKNFFISQYIFPNIEDKKPVYWSLSDIATKYSARHDKTFVLTASTPYEYNSTDGGNKRFEMMSSDYIKMNFLDNAGGCTFTISPESQTDTICFVIIRADAEEKPTKFDYQEVMVYGKTPKTLEVRRDASMPVVSIAVMNLKFANKAGENSYYSISALPDILGVDDQTESDFTINGISPSPAENISSLSINVKDLGLYNYSIYNIDGKLMTNGSFVANLLNNVVPLNLTEFNTGIYLIKVSNGKEFRTTNFIVK